jgi:hypothetical protein
VCNLSPPQKKGGGCCQGCGSSVCLFNVFINDIREYLGTEEKHSPMFNSLRILGLLFADDFVIASFTICGLQEKLN